MRELAVREELVFVTNNARDFQKLMGEIELHPGLIVIIRNATPSMQHESFERALHELGALTDMINRVIEVDVDKLRIYELPKLYRA